MNVLFLDDNPNRTKKFRSQVPCAKCVETAEECIEAIQKEEEWDYVFLDHDLGGETFVSSEGEDCGMEVVRWMCKHKPKVNKVIVHTANPPASEKMFSWLEFHGFNVERISFLNLMPVIHDVVHYDA